MKRSVFTYILVAAVLLTTGCQANIEAAIQPSATLTLTPSHTPRPSETPTPETTATPQGYIQPLFVEVLAKYPHDTSSFTQGLVWYQGILYESTGQYGESSLRQVDPITGQVILRYDLPPEYFAEGLALVDDRLIQLTWKEHTALIYRQDDFILQGSFNYPTEGWGLCYDGTSLYMSDGTSSIFIRDPQTFAEIQRMTVFYGGQPIEQLNELECVGDFIYANVWKTDQILKIDKTTGFVVGSISADNLLTPEERAAMSEGSVLNGIAYNPETNTFFITGKNWPWLFDVRFVP